MHKPQFGIFNRRMRINDNLSPIENEREPESLLRQKGDEAPRTLMETTKEYRLNPSISEFAFQSESHPSPTILTYHETECSHGQVSNPS